MAARSGNANPVDPEHVGESVPDEFDGVAGWAVVAPRSVEPGRADGGVRTIDADHYVAHPPHIVTTRPSQGSIVLHASGDITGNGLDELKQAILTRVRSSATTVVLDLSGVTFLGVDGLHVLRAMTQCAQLNRTRLQLVIGSAPAVERLLRAAALAGVRVLGETEVSSAQREG